MALPALPGAPTAVALPALPGAPAAVTLPAESAPLRAALAVKHGKQNFDRGLLALRPHRLKLLQFGVFTNFFITIIPWKVLRGGWSLPNDGLSKNSHDMSRPC
jgi:hypothetical protein